MATSLNTARPRELLESWLGPAFPSGTIQEVAVFRDMSTGVRFLRASFIDGTALSVARTGPAAWTLVDTAGNVHECASLNELRGSALMAKGFNTGCRTAIPVRKAILPVWKSPVCYVLLPFLLVSAVVWPAIWWMWLVAAGVVVSGLLVALWRSIPKTILWSPDPDYPSNPKSEQESVHAAVLLNMLRGRDWGRSTPKLPRTITDHLNKAEADCAKSAHEGKSLEPTLDSLYTTLQQVDAGELTVRNASFT